MCLQLFSFSWTLWSSTILPWRASIWVSESKSASPTFSQFLVPSFFGCWTHGMPLDYMASNLSKKERHQFRHQYLLFLPVCWVIPQLLRFFLQLWLPCRHVLSSSRCEQLLTLYLEWETHVPWLQAPFPSLHCWEDMGTWFVSILQCSSSRTCCRIWSWTLP